MLKIKTSTNRTTRRLTALLADRSECKNEYYILILKYTLIIKTQTYIIIETQSENLL